MSESKIFLKPCLHCGSKNVGFGRFLGMDCVICRECSAVMPAPGLTKEEAAENWNKNVRELKRGKDGYYIEAK